MININDKQANGLTKIKTLNPNASIRFSEKSEVNSHLYKLVESPVIKYIGKGTDKEKYPDVSPEDFLEMGHAHVFRTVDTDGNYHTKSVPIAGHYHLVELEIDPENPDKAPKVVAMSGPMQTMHKRIKGKMTVVDVPLNEYDHHIHDITYVKSERIQARTSNKDAASFLSKEASKIPQAPSGLGEAGSRK